MKVTGKVIKTTSGYDTEFTYYLVDNSSKQHYRFHKTLEAQAVINLNKTVDAEVHEGIKFVQKIY